MLIYLFLISEILILNYFSKNKALSRKNFCIIIGISFILITGLRSANVGSDTTGYYLSFYDLANVSLSDAIFEKREIAYYILAWIVQRTTNSFTVLTLLAAATFYVPIMKLIEKYSPDPGLSCLVLMAFNFFQFSMTGIRQTISMGFAVLFFMELFDEKPKTLKMLTFLILSILFHRAALIILLFLLVKPCTKNKNIPVILSVLIPIMFIFRKPFITSLQGFFDYIGFGDIEFTATYGGMSTFLVYLLLVFIGLFFIKEKEKSQGAAFILMMIIGTIFQTWVFEDAIFFRIAWYFSIFMIIYIPRIIEESSLIDRQKFALNLGIYACVLFMYLFITKGSATVLPYEFFWQG